MFVSEKPTCISVMWCESLQLKQQWYILQIYHLEKVVEVACNKHPHAKIVDPVAAFNIVSFPDETTRFNFLELLPHFLAVGAEVKPAAVVEEDCIKVFKGQDVFSFP